MTSSVLTGIHHDATAVMISARVEPLGAEAVLGPAPLTGVEIFNRVPVEAPLRG